MSEQPNKPREWLHDLEHEDAALAALEERARIDAPSSESPPLGSSEAEDGLDRDTATPLLHEVRAVLAEVRGRIVAMERDSLKGRTHDVWERAYCSGLTAARREIDALYARLQPPAEKEG